MKKGADKAINLDDIDFFSTEEEDMAKLNGTNKPAANKTTPATLPPWIIEAQKKAKQQKKEIDNREEIEEFLANPPQHLQIDKLFGDLSWVEKLSEKDRNIFNTLYQILAQSTNLSNEVTESLLNHTINQDLLLSYQDSINASHLRWHEEQESLEMILFAIEKLYKGTYGVCELCKKDIGDRRLSAKPYAVFCIDCREKIENIQKHH